MLLSPKFIGKYMRLAKQVGEDNNPCYSRHLGVVLVRVHADGASKVVGTGYNGPPRRTPHCDAEEYLRDIVWPQLKQKERLTALRHFGEVIFDADGQFRMTSDEQSESFLRHATGCKQCPRRLIGAKTGERTELCSCEHSEKNAIVNAAADLHGAVAFCWCVLACWDCAKLMINAGIKKAFFVDDGSCAWNGGSDYSFGVRWLFEKARVEIVVEKPEVYLR